MCAPGKQILLFSPDKKLDLLDGIFGSEFSVAIHRKLPDSAQIEQNFQINSNLILIAGEGAQADSVTVFLDECEKKGRNVVFILALISPSSVHNSSWQIGRAHV